MHKNMHNAKQNVKPEGTGLIALAAADAWSQYSMLPTVAIAVFTV